MIAAADDFKPERLQGAQHPVGGRIDWELGHSASRGNSRLGDKRLQNRVVLGWRQSFRPESLDVKGDGRTHISQSRLVGVALADNGTPREAQRIRDVAV